MKRLLIITSVVALALAAPVNAQGNYGGGSIGAGIGFTFPQADIDMLEHISEIALCGVYGGLFGNCGRVARDLGITRRQARSLGRTYWRTPQDQREAFLNSLGQ